MSYDPNFPPTNADLISAEFRTQFQGLKALIDLLQSINAAQIDSVTTGNPGDPATATVTVNGQTLHFTLGIPRGDEGVQGIQGNPGTDGMQGPPFAQAIIDAVNTLNPGELATVTVSFDGTNVHFTFGIPRGETGGPGNDGGQGIQGSPGLDGAPGEVTNAALATAISGTSNNTNVVALLSLAVSDPPSQSEVQAIANKLDELILAGRR